MRLHSYVVARDYGFAPNPFFGVCTLATCKPTIRGVAAVGDWVMGTGSRVGNRQNRVVYAMRVTETMTFEQYWNDQRFQQKKPNIRGSKKQAFGDNIYFRDRTGRRWCQLDSHHSLADGSPNPTNVNVDTGTNRVLVSDEFVYWGGSGPELPKPFVNYDSNTSVLAGRGHRNHFPPQLVVDLVAWIKSLHQNGFGGEPLDWIRTP
jgi:Nucleotide modification associated domain 2